MFKPKTRQVKAEFITGSIPKHLFRMCLPVLIGLACNFSFVIFDVYFVSLLGSSPLAAVSYCMPVVDFMIGVGIGVGIAISSVTARYIGSGNIDGVTGYTFNSIVFCIIFAGVLSIAGELTIPYLFTRLGAPSNLLPLIHSFISIWYLGIAFLLLIFAFSNALRAVGRAKESSYIQIGGAVLNFVLDIILIFHFHLGIKGAALADLLTRICSVITLLYFVYQNGLISLPASFSLKTTLKDWRKMFSIMIPASITNSIPALATAWSVTLLSKYSATSVAGFGVATKIQSIFIIPLFALSASIGPIVGQNYAAKNFDRSFLALKQCTLFSIFWGLLVSAIMLVFGKIMVYQFSANPLVVKVATEYLNYIPISYTGWGVLMMVSANFNSLGMPLRSTLLSILRLVIIFMPLSYLLNRYYSYYGIFYAMIISTFIVAIFGYFLAKAKYSSLLHD